MVSSGGGSAFTPPVTAAFPAPAAMAILPSELQAVDAGNGTDIPITGADNRGDETGFDLIRQTQLITNDVEDYGWWIQFPQGPRTAMFSTAPVRARAGTGSRPTDRYTAAAPASSPAFDRTCRALQAPRR